MTQRTYPQLCRSLFCGETSCPQTCSNLPELLDFKAWQQQHNAFQPDPIWAPTVWAAQD
jgi:hypothetical protein